MAFEPPRQGRWTTSLCACCEDCASCCCAVWCPCVVVGRLVEIIDQGNTTCFHAGCCFFWLDFCAGCCCSLRILGWWWGSCAFIYTCGYRARLRGKYNLPEAGCTDCCADTWCLCCSIAQQYRELQYRGIDPAAGYFAQQEVCEQSGPTRQKPATQPAPAQVIVYQNNNAPAPQVMAYAPAAPQVMGYRHLAPVPQTMPDRQAVRAPPKMGHQQSPPAPQRMGYQQPRPAPQKSMGYQQPARPPPKTVRC